MSLAIGLRFYRLTIRRKGDNKPLPVGPGSTPCDLYEYVGSFVKRRTDPTEETAEPRTWYFEKKAANSIRAVHGYLHYGTHGFESKLKDAKTKKPKYERQSSDLEEIPLYFQIWSPSDAEYGIMAFQSFGGRSCVTFVRTAMMKDFVKAYPGYTLSFKTLVPAQSVIEEAPVKTITFVKPKRSSDRAERMLGRPVDEVDYQLIVKAKRRGGMLATFKDLRSLLKEDKNGFVEFDGREFEGVTADVKMGRKRRTVGLFGSGIDAGLIDVSENVSRDKSGHPKFSSITDEVDDLMEEMYGNLKT